MLAVKSSSAELWLHTPSRRSLSVSLFLILSVVAVWSHCVWWILQSDNIVLWMTDIPRGSKKMGPPWLFSN